MNLLKKKIILIILISGIIYLSISIYSDLGALIVSFSNFNILYLPIILLLSLFNYVLRFYKWEYYLRIIDVQVKKKDSLTIFLSGFLMSITPGKSGEIFKSYLLKKVINAKISKTAPVVVVERITDFLSLAILALLGSLFFKYGIIISLGTTIFIILSVLIITNKNAFNKFLILSSRISLLKNFTSKFQQLFDSTEALLKIKPLIIGLILSIISWSFECVGYYLVIRNFSNDLSLVWSTFSYSFSTIAGAISMLPGGLGITESSFLIMLNTKGLSLSDSTAITLITRLSTLWFAIIIGIISFLIFSVRYGNLEIKEEQ
jgi:uncharacterized protein (TIRG00374 family)